MTRGVLPIFMSVILIAGTAPLSFAASEPPQLNFKIYSPDANSTPADGAAPADANAGTTPDATAPAENTTPADNTPAAGAQGGGTSGGAADAAPAADKPADPAQDTVLLKKEEPETAAMPAAEPTAEAKPADTPGAEAKPADTTAAETKPADTTAASTGDSTTTAADGTTAATAADSTTTGDATAGGDKKVLQGYIRVVPKDTKVPIIMDTAVDSDTSQEGDEFAARTSEDLTIDGAVVVPAGSVIKGRIASLNAPKHLNRSGSVALKFDTVTTPDNRQIPLVANLVAHGGVVHARRGMKDYAIDTGVVMAPVLAGGLIGLVAGASNSSSSTGSTTSTSNTNSNSINKAGAAMIGVGVGLAVGVAILCAKKGKKVDVRPGDELKIQLAEELRMPMM